MQMEEERSKPHRISDLIRRARPFTAASSLVNPSRPILSPNQNSNQNHKPSTVTPQKPKTLKPFYSPLPLIGTLDLPSFSDDNLVINCACFRFSDDSAVVCCYVLEFDPKMIGRKIKALSWNFIPTKGGKNGFLEIISWSFVQDCSGNFCCLSEFSSFCMCLGACDIKDDSQAKSFVFGVIQSVSPVSVVPCERKDSGSRAISGFLLNVLVCECKLCRSNVLISGLKCLAVENVKDHCFVRTVIVYFFGLTSSWHPVVSRLIGDIVLLSGLKKKVVFIGKEESQLMYVTVDNVSLHVHKLFKKRNLICEGGVRGKGECGSYTGVVTGVYMQGMVVELDENVMLLLTDQYLTVPHCMRVGAIVTLKNVHLVDPKFSWGKLLILGACCRTSVHVEFFSPFQSGCHFKSYSHSLLQKFIDSLSFSARLWVLLVVSCFRRKFSGVLTENEILGSKHKEGLVQKYAVSHLPQTALRSRHGLLLEFCKHDLCCDDREVDYGHLRLVLPIAHLISYCEATWKNNIHNRENCAESMCGIGQKKPLFCGGRYYAQSIRRILRAEEIGVLILGTLKVSSSSGRLQLADATGEIDFMLDLPATWDFDKIFEAKDLMIIMEGTPPKLVGLDSVAHQPLSCRSIFSNVPLVKLVKTSVYLYSETGDEDSRSRSLFFDWKRNFEKFESGKYHLLMLTHKFPIRQKFHGDQRNRSNIFAQAVLLPWELLVTGQCQDARISLEQLRNSLEELTKDDKFPTYKRCKSFQGSIGAGATDYGLIDCRDPLGGDSSGCSSYNNSYADNTSSVSNHSLDVQCLIACKGINCHFPGIICCTNENAKIVSGCKLPQSMLLEFSPESFCKFKALKIGGCYLLKHEEEDKLCFSKENHQVKSTKQLISSETPLRSVIFSSIEGLQSLDISESCPFPKSHVISGDVNSKRVEVSPPASNGVGPGIYSDINVFVPAATLNSLVNAINILDSGPSQLTDSFEEESDIHDNVETVTSASVQPSGLSSSNYLLPVGDLTSLCGLVVALHDCDSEAFPGQSGVIPHDGHLPMFLQRNRGLCVHLLVENNTVTIFCDLSKSAYPIGLGRHAYATFHRILVLGGQNKYMMTPASFITINNIGLPNQQCSDEFSCASRSAGSRSVSSPRTDPTALISDVMQLSQLKPMQFRCRIIAVYILVLEKARKTEFSQSSLYTKHSVGIPLAGFIMDDGSSSCCCWADSERAVALLGLDLEDYTSEASAKNHRSYKTGAGLPYGSTVARLNHIIEQHGIVVVKNYGSIPDSSYPDIAFSVGSDKSIRSSDEDLLTTLTINPTFSKSWTLSGSLMDPEAISRLEERLIQENMAMPSMQNVWATSVYHTDILAEARNIIQELV